MSIPYLLLQNLLTMAYLICLFLIIILFFRPVFLHNLLEKTGIPKIKYYYYIVPGFLSTIFFIINYLIQTSFFELGGAGPLIEYYKALAQTVSKGVNPYESPAPLGYGPLFFALFILGIRVYNDLFTIALIMFFFYLGTVLLAAKFARKFFNDEKSASAAGVITALNPLLWYTSVTMLTTDIFVAFAVLLLFYLFFTLNQAQSEPKKTTILVTGVSIGILSSLKFIPLIVFLALLLSKSKLELKEKISIGLSCGFLFLLIHAVTYHFWGMDMIKWAYIFQSSSVGDFSPILLFSSYIPAYTKELFSISTLSIDVSLLLLFVGLLLSYSLITYKKLGVYSSIVIIMSAFFLISKKVHVAYFSWFIAVPLLYALYCRKSEIAIPSFLIILIPRLWQVFVEKELGSPLELHTQIIKTTLILSMIIILIYLSWASIKIERHSTPYTM